MTKKLESVKPNKSEKPKTQSLTPLKKLRLIVRCKAGEPIDAVARECGKTEETLRQWMDEEETIRETLDGLRSAGWMGVGDEFRSVLTGVFVRGDGWEDVGDEWPASLRHLYEQSLYSLETPDKFVDRKFAAKYKKWLKGHSKQSLVLLALELGLQPADVLGEQFNARFDPWLQAVEVEK